MNKARFRHSSAHKALFSLVVLGIITAATPTAQAAVSFLGVAAGDATTTSVTFWTRAVDSAAPASVQLSVDFTTDPAFANGIVHKPGACTTDSTKDYTCKATVTGLSPNTVYYYRFVGPANETSNTGKIKTAPLASAAVPVHFAFSGDYDGLIRPYALASRLPQQNLDFYVSLGDIIYENASNLTTNGAHNGQPWLNSPSVTLSGSSASLNGIPTFTGFATAAQLKADYEKKYREQFLPVNTGGQNALQPLYAAQGIYTAYDNHELGNRQYINGGAPAGGSIGGAAGTDMPTGRGVDARKNGAGNPGNVNDANTSPSDYMNRSVGFKTLQDVFLYYQPAADRGTVTNASDPRANGTKQLYFAQPWGKNAIYIMTDSRSYRDIRLKTADGSADDTTAPRANNPQRTYLGATQLAWLKQTLLNAQNAGTPWKFVTISDPIDQVGPIGGALSLSNLPSFGTGSTYAPVNADGGKSFIGGYRAERNELLKFIADNKITNVVFIATDDHQNRVNEVTYSPTDPENQASYINVPSAFSIVAGPLGATGPDLITNHTFAMAQQFANSLVAAQQSAGVEPFGLMGYPGLHDVLRDGDPTAGTAPQAVDFYSPDSFNFNVLDVTADGKTLTVSSIGMDATAQNAGIEYAAGPQARTIFSFKVDTTADPVLSLVNAFGQTAPTQRNDYDGFAGMQLKVGENPLSVFALGRACLPGNTQTHTVKLVSASTKADVPGATAQVDMLNCTPGQTVYSNLASPVTLVPGTTYYLVSLEFKNGDKFYEHAPIAVKADASVLSSVYFNGVNWLTPDGPNTSYVPPDMRYATLPAPGSLSFILDYNKDNQALRNNFTGFVGAAVKVGPAPLKVTSLGRACLAGNSQSHTVKLVNGSTGADIAGATASVNLAGCINSQFVYTDLAGAVTLLPNTTYYLLSQETTGGDKWYDQGAVKTRTEAVITDAIFAYGAGWAKQPGLNNSYGPSNFKYSVLNCTLEVGCPVSTPVRINEIESNGGTPDDWVELYNPGPGPANIGGYILRDNDNSHTYVIPAGTTIAPNAYFVLETATFGFGLGAPDSVRLFDPSGALADTYSWAVHAGTTYGRCPNVTGAFITTFGSTKGAANNCTAPPVTSVHINEIESNGGTPDDWIELINTGASPADISGWKMLDNDDTHTAYVFPANSIIAPGGYLVVDTAQFGFGLGAADNVRIFDLAGAIYESYSWTAHAATTYGRCPNGTGSFITTISSTKGTANDCSLPVITTLHLNEVESNGGTPDDWFELINTGLSTIDISGWKMLDNDNTHAPYIFPSGSTIVSGGYLVVDTAQFGFGLGAADSVRIFDSTGAVYESYSWTAHAATTYGRCPNGTGEFTTTVSSTKGAANDCGSAIAPLKINEIESNGGTPDDWVELINTGATIIDISGWKMLDNDDTHAPYIFPTGSTIASGGYLVIDTAQFGFGLGAADNVRIFDARGAIYETYSWTAHAATTYGRCPNGTGEFTTTASSTKGTANACGAPAASPVKINEVESDGGVPGDWVEFYNPGNVPVSIAGFVFRDNDANNGYTIPAGTTIPAGGYYVLETAVFGFGLGGADSARLFDSVGTLVDTYTWAAHATTTYGRCPNGSGQFTTTTASTKGAVNACPGDITFDVWPGGATIQTAGAGGRIFGGNMSGLVYDSSGTVPVLWAARNSPGAIFRLIFNGSAWVSDTANDWGSGKLVRYPDGTGDPDSEGITFAGAGASLGLYVATERNNSNGGAVSKISVLRFDPLAAGTTLTATHEWNLTSDLPVVGQNLGAEAITWIPDTFLTSKNFFDEAKGHAYNPAEYPNHGTGLFFIGLEGNGMIYGYALDQSGTTYTKVATIASGFPGVMELQFDRDSTELWAICDDTCQGRSVVLRIDGTGKFTVAKRYERPTGMPNFNNEGFAISPAASCSGGTKPVFWADDTEDDGQALRSGTLTCLPL